MKQNYFLYPCRRLSEFVEETSLISVSMYISKLKSLVHYFNDFTVHRQHHSIIIHVVLYIIYNTVIRERTGLQANYLYMYFIIAVLPCISIVLYSIIIFFFI